MNWVSFYNKTTVLNVVKIYSAFFVEYPIYDYRLNRLEARHWNYSWKETSFLANRTVMIYSKNEALLYDYSDILNFELTEQNVDNWNDLIKIKVHDLTSVNYSDSKIKEIFENNAKAAIQAAKLTQQAIKLKSLKEDF